MKETGSSKQNAEMLDNMVEDGYARKNKVIGTQTQICSGDMWGGAWGVHTEVLRVTYGEHGGSGLRSDIAVQIPDAHLLSFLQQVRSTHTYAYSAPGIVG